MTAPIVLKNAGGVIAITRPLSLDLMAHRATFDTRANRALRGTVTGESMATWGERYLTEARAVVKMGQRPGQLWERVAEGRSK